MKICLNLFANKKKKKYLKENTLISPEVRHLLKSLQNSQTYH